MSVIAKYLSGLFFKNMGLCLAGFLSLYLVVDFIEKISDFMNQKIAVKLILLYFAAQVPNILVLMLPVAALTSVLITLVLLARNSEIVAFKGSGVSLWRLSSPFLISGFSLCVLVFILSNLVTPMTSEVASEIWDGLVRNRRPDEQKVTVEDVWIREVRLLMHFGSYNEENSEARDVSLIFLDNNLNIQKRAEAEKAFFRDDGVILMNAEIKDYHGLDDSEAKHITFTRPYEIFLPDIQRPPQGLGGNNYLNSDELDFKSLSDNVKLLKAEGFYPVRQMVDLQFKFSRPFITLIMLIVGIPIGFWREKGGSVAMGLVPGLLLSFAYLVALELSRTVGYAGILPPFMAAWLPNCFFLLLGLFLFSYVRQ